MPSEFTTFRRHVHPIAMIMLTPELPDSLVLSITMLYATQNLFLNKSNLQNKPRGSLPHCRLVSRSGTLLSTVLPPRCSRFGCSPQEAAPTSGTELFVTLLADADLTSERIGQRDKGFGLGDTRYA